MRDLARAWHHYLRCAALGEIHALCVQHGLWVATVIRTSESLAVAGGRFARLGLPCPELDIDYHPGA